MKRLAAQAFTLVFLFGTLIQPSVALPEAHLPPGLLDSVFQPASKMEGNVLASPAGMQRVSALLVMARFPAASLLQSDWRPWRSGAEASRWTQRQNARLSWLNRSVNLRCRLAVSRDSLGPAARRAVERLNAQILPALVPQCSDVQLQCEFSAPWATRFASRLPDKFHRGSRELPAWMLRQQGHFLLATSEHWRLLELPYKEGHCVFDCFLPLDTGLDSLPGLDAEQRNALLAKLAPTATWVTFPEFTLTNVTFPTWSCLSTASPAVPTVGQAASFSFRGDGVGEPEFLYQPQAHAVGSTPPASPLTYFRADHPFWFEVRDRETDTTWLCGKLESP